MFSGSKDLKDWLSKQPDNMNKRWKFMIPSLKPIPPMPSPTRERLPSTNP